MSDMQLLRLFISERLSAAAEEIFLAVQKAVSQQQQQQHSTDQHILKQEAYLHIEDMHLDLESDNEMKNHQDPPSAAQGHCNGQVPEPPVIKQEGPEPWGGPGREQPLGRETPVCQKSCIYSDVMLLQNHNAGNQASAPVSNPSAEEVSTPSRPCSTFFPDCSVTLINIGPKLGLEKQTGQSARQVPVRRSLTGGEPPSPANEKTNTRSRRFCGNAHLATDGQLHTGETPFACQVCGKRFQHSKSVSVHMKIHTDERPYQCHICGKEFRQTGNLNVHMRTHTGEKPYSCTLCGKKFSRNNLLTRHMTVHTDPMTLSLDSLLQRNSMGLTP